MMTTTQIEVRAVAEIDKYISTCKDLESYLFKNDRTPVWDGDIYVYNPTGEDKANHSISNMIRRIPSQVKGHKVDSLSEKGTYSIEVEYIDAYCKDGALIFFYVEICGLKARVFYNLFTISDLQKLKAKAAGQKTTTITLTDYLTEDNYPAFNDRLGEFANNMPLQGDKSKMVKLDESQEIHEILKDIKKREAELEEQKRQEKAYFMQTIQARADKTEADIKKLESTKPSGWLDKIIALYRDTITGTEEYFERSEYARWLHNFALFLSKQRLYHLIDNLYDRALVIFRELENLPDVAMTLNNLAIIHKDTNRMKEAEGEYVEALKNYRQLAETNPSAYLLDVAMTLNNLANLHSDTNRMKEAEGKYEEALKIYRELAETNPSAYLPYVARTLNNLANLHSDTNHMKEAEDEYEEALKIRRQLAETNPSAYLPEVATTLNNLAVLHKNTNRRKEAEGEFEEALKIRRELAKKNPSVYLPNVANTLNNLAILHKNTNRMKEAEGEYVEALKIYRELAETNPSAYMPDVAMTLNNLAILHKNTNREKEAEGEYVEALKIRRELAETNPSAYLPNVAMTLNNLGILYAKTDRFEEAEKLCLEALNIYREFAELVPSVYQPEVEKTLKNLELIKQNKRNGNKGCLPRLIRWILRLFR